MHVIFTCNSWGTISLRWWFGSVEINFSNAYFCLTLLMTLKNVFVQFSSKKIINKYSKGLLDLHYTCDSQLGCRITLLILLIAWCVKDHKFSHLQRNGQVVELCSQALLSNFVIPMCLASLLMVSLVILIIQCIIGIFT